jgi:hypothetical protein
MIAEFELTKLILKFVAVRKPREDCEKTVNPEKQKHLPRGESEDVFVFLYRGELYLLILGSPPT